MGARYHHVWVRGGSHLCPGLVLAWRQEAGDWTAWCVWVEPGTLGVHQGWVEREKLRPILADPPKWG